ncbi:hypothetical protein FNF27_03744 [Cafeteria roenbergensis]|uniref:Phosducin domain-containing protein n=1 Tax=Cafeteria roenbergensis TaxID=33653 RepID=A0A5A8DN56_CAFRO|nr:hypothetical protein FNF29_04093 [Cafeteria roenbergensis]KAA0155505.1 hypothetical protein FNF28_06707 [Cafeteria roenbergensis]KAA0166047.1 hypothetical protein FNF31_01660 [Cafeteria roenbergensis]KAA0174849.1 hypothetical protein FNF27_03744 [Cafeteria roenbergensis]|eukprot:KAA0152229.1 hypothetical protein FNF29_04093 [Cafeteria roenbergensis]
MNVGSSSSYTRAKGETTEWEDLQRKHGNLPPLEPEEEEEEEEEVEPDDGVRGRTEGELEDAEDDEAFADDRELAALRRRRIAQLRAAAAANKFGTLRTITRAEYVAEVTRASSEGDGLYVALHLFSEGVPRCREVDASLATMAARHRSVKFLRIQGKDCIEGYPDRNCPSLLVYHKGECVARLVGAAQTGSSVTKLTGALVEAGAITAEEAVDAAVTGAEEETMGAAAAAAAADLDDF